MRPLPRPVAAALLLVALVYLPVLGFDLVYDDHWVLADNGYLRTRGDLALLWTGEATRLHVPDAFRPGSVLLDLVTVRLWGLSAPAHHALSLALHLTVVGLLARWILARTATETRSSPAEAAAPPVRAAAVAGLFGLLAVHAETVSVVSYREDLLAAALGLAALLLAERATRAGGRGRVWALGGAGALAAGAAASKMSAAPLALVGALAWSGGLGPKLPWRRWLPAAGALALGAGLAAGHRLLALGTLAPHAADARLATTLAGRAPVLAEHVRILALDVQRLLVPLGLSPDHPDRLARWSDPATLCCAAGLALAVAWAAWRHLSGRAGAASFSVLATFALLLPVSGVVPLRNMEAERFSYLPAAAASVGIAAALLALGELAARRPRAARHEAFAPLLLFAVLQGSAGQAQARAFRSDTRLWEVAAIREPGSARALAMEGLLRIPLLARAQAQGAPPPALSARVAGACRAARLADPREGLAHMCLARLAATARRWGEARDHIARALELGLSRPDRAYAALGQISLDLPPADRAAGLAALSDAVARHPFASGLVAAAGRVRHRAGEPDRALARYRSARRLAPERWDVVAWGLELALDLGDAPAAWALWRDEAKLLTRADPTLLASLRRRLYLAHRLDLQTPHALLAHGVFPP